jgi:hypothetical protein
MPDMNDKIAKRKKMKLATTILMIDTNRSQNLDRLLIFLKKITIIQLRGFQLNLIMAIILI